MAAEDYDDLDRPADYTAEASTPQQDVFDALAEDGIYTADKLIEMLREAYGARVNAGYEGVLRAAFANRNAGRVTMVIQKVTPASALHPDVVRKRTKIYQEMGKLREELARLNSIPNEPTGPNPAVCFTKTFGGSTRYNYAAIKANGFWYISGDKDGRKRMNWPDLVEFINQREATTPRIGLLAVHSHLN